MKDKEATVKATCILIKGGSVLATPIHDSHSGRHFFRILGGGVHTGESSKQAVHRELKEEIGVQLDNVALHQVVENSFQYEGEAFEEIEFVYKAICVENWIYDLDSMLIQDDPRGTVARWIPLKDVCKGDVQLYPEIDWGYFCQD